MALPATDNFNRTNGALGTNWTGSVGSDLAIFNNTVRGSSGADSSMYWSADAPNANQYCQVTLAVANASGYGGPTVRGSSTDWVMLDAANGEATDHYKIEWYNSGSWTAIGSQYNVTPTASDVMKITADGSTFTGYINGTQRCQGSNGTAPATGYGGIYVYAELHQVDDFEVGNLSTSTASLVVATANRRVSTLRRM